MSTPENEPLPGNLPDGPGSPIDVPPPEVPGDAPDPPTPPLRDPESPGPPPGA